MKKFVCVLLLAALLCLSGSALAQGVGSPVIPPHTHEGGAATCTEPAICVRCGQPYGEPLGHLEEITSPRIPNCTEPGLTEGVVCARCGEVLKAQEEIPALGHTEETVPGWPAACTEDGMTDGVKCSVCGEMLKAQEEIPALGHTEETLPAKAATCTETGLTDGVKCSVCGEMLKAQEEIPALGHTEETVPGWPATCTEDGMTDGVKCSVCGEILTAQQVIPGDHIWGPWTDVEYDYDSKLMHAKRVCQRDETHVDGGSRFLKEDEEFPEGTKIINGAATYEVVKGTLTLISFDASHVGGIHIPDALYINGLKYKITAIGQNAFRNCKKATVISLGAYVRKISAGAFTGCKRLCELSLPYSGGITIDKDAFKGFSAKNFERLMVHVNKSMSSTVYDQVKKQLTAAGVVKIRKDLIVNDKDF